MRATHLLSLLSFTPLLLAQGMPVPDGKGRMLQLFDLHRCRASAWPDQDAAGPQGGLRPDAAAVPDQPPAARPHQDEQYLADFLRPFVEPPLGPGDDLKVLGGRWLTMLGDPTQVANFERLMAGVVTNRELLVTTSMRIVHMERQPFERRLQPMLTAKAGAEATFECVLPAAKAAELVAAIEGADVLEAPRLTVSPLQRASMSVRQDISYVQDFTLARHADAVVADPVIGVVWDGLEIDLCAIVLADGLVALRCDVQSQQVQQPMPKFETDLGTGAPVTIQLPRTTGVRFRQTARVAAGELIVLAAQKVDGDYLLAIVEARVDRR
jgi:hypothetical protein